MCTIKKYFIFFFEIVKRSYNDSLRYIAYSVIDNPVMIEATSNPTKDITVRSVCKYCLVYKNMFSTIRYVGGNQVKRLSKKAVLDSFDYSTIVP